MADTSELLRLLDESIEIYGPGDSNMVPITVGDCRALKSRLQAEAQAPTTAVLTEQERQARNDMAITAANLRTLAELRIENPGCTLPINVDFLKSVAELSTWAIAALTVVAPAPAPSMPTRKLSEFDVGSWIDGRPLNCAMPNIIAGRMGRVANAAGDPERLGKDVGDDIDRGLILLQLLNENGLNVSVAKGDTP